MLLLAIAGISTSARCTEYRGRLHPASNHDAIESSDETSGTASTTVTGHCPYHTACSGPAWGGPSLRLGRVCQVRPCPFASMAFRTPEAQAGLHRPWQRRGP